MKNMKMKVVRAIGEYNHNLGGVPGHVFGRRAGIIPVGAEVDVISGDSPWVTVMKYEANDEYGNNYIVGQVGLAPGYLVPA
jgi:hypothetical protein